MKIGYARVSARDQNLEVQLEQLSSYHCDKVFQEKVSGKSKDNREQLLAALEFTREGDILVVTKLDRLARNTLDLLSIVETLSKKKVELVVLNQNIDTSTATGKATLGMLAVFAEWERDINEERRLEGIANAKAKGVKFGRKAKLTEEDKIEIVKMAEGYTMTRQAIADHFDINIATVFQILKDAKNNT